MTGAEQRKKLQSQIWAIANDVRGAVDGWDFKQYVLGTLFYRFISENFSLYIEADDNSINREVVEIAQLNAEIETTVKKINQLRADIDAIVADLEGTAA